jgi:hypothetical protein
MENERASEIQGEEGCRFFIGDVLECKRTGSHAQAEEGFLSIDTASHKFKIGRAENGQTETHE